ncbi:hypothetical protein K0M31_000248, partial [Melipona bicolor]
VALITSDQPLKREQIARAIKVKPGTQLIFECGALNSNAGEEDELKENSFLSLTQVSGQVG